MHRKIFRSFLCLVSVTLAIHRLEKLLFATEILTENHNWSNEELLVKSQEMEANCVDKENIVNVY